MLKFSPIKLRLPKKKKQESGYDLLVITPFRGRKEQVKLPILKLNQRSPRRIPKEYQCFGEQKKGGWVSKTPLPYKKSVDCLISKEFLMKAMNKVQHVMLVKNLTEHASKVNGAESGLIGGDIVKVSQVDKGDRSCNRNTSRATEEILKDCWLSSRSRVRSKKENFEMNWIF